MVLVSQWNPFLSNYIYIYINSQEPVLFDSTFGQFYACTFDLDWILNSHAVHATILS